jgi:hypothetical protein
MILGKQLVKIIYHYFLLGDLIILSLFICRPLHLLSLIGGPDISDLIIFTHYVIRISNTLHFFHGTVLLEEVICRLKIASKLCNWEHLTCRFTSSYPSLLLWLHQLILLGWCCNWLFLFRDYGLILVLFDAHETCYWSSLWRLDKRALNLRSDIILLIDFWSEWLAV